MEPKSTGQKPIGYGNGSGEFFIHGPAPSGAKQQDGGEEEAFEKVKSIESWETRRKAYFARQDAMRYPGLVFSEKELKANQKFTDLRKKSIEKEVKEDFFTKCFQYFDKFPEFTLWDTIKRLPKVSVFHLHSDVCCDREFFIELTHRFKDKIYQKKDNTFYYYFHAEIPKDYEDEEAGYVLLDELRQKSGDPEKFDEDLKTQIFMCPRDREQSCADQW